MISNVKAGLLKVNFRGLSKVIMSKNRVVNVNGVNGFVNFTTFMKMPSVRNVIGNRDRKYSTQIADSSEANEDVEDVQQHSQVEEQNTDKIFEEIAAGDPDCLKRLKMIEFEVAVLREEEQKVPDIIKKRHWEELLEIKSVTLRRKHLAFLRLNEIKALNDIQKSQARLMFHEQLKQELGFHYYGLSGHSMFMRIYERAMSKVLHQRLLNAKLEIVLDCSYEEYMSNINIKLCAKQIAYCINQVKTHKYPGKLRLCNFSQDGALRKVLPLYCQLNESPVTKVHSESYLDIFPKERLLYLSPHTKNDLKTFDHNDVFIIGAYLDKGSSLKASLAKAKEHNLRIARLPIDEYLLWRKGSKSLPLSTVLNIILDMAFYGDWRVALKNIPRRCLSD